MPVQARRRSESECERALQSEKVRVANCFRVNLTIMPRNTAQSCLESFRDWLKNPCHAAFLQLEQSAIRGPNLTIRPLVWIATGVCLFVFLGWQDDTWQCLWILGTKSYRTWWGSCGPWSSWVSVAMAELRWGILLLTQVGVPKRTLDNGVNSLQLQLQPSQKKGLINQLDLLPTALKTDGTPRVNTGRSLNGMLPKTSWWMEGAFGR